MREVEERIYRTLELLKIDYQRHDHPAVFTCEEADEHCTFEGAKTKNLFLRAKRGNRYILLVVDAAKQVDLSRLADALGTGRLSFGSKERLAETLGVEPGAVSPLAVVHGGGSVEVVMDESILEADTVQLHPGVNTSTLVLRLPDLLRYLGHCGTPIRRERFE
jgi:Ala-tRNA(Pro) deacylase